MSTPDTIQLGKFFGFRNKRRNSGAARGAMPRCRVLRARFQAAGLLQLVRVASGSLARSMSPAAESRTPKTRLRRSRAGQGAGSVEPGRRSYDCSST